MADGDWERSVLVKEQRMEMEAETEKAKADANLLIAQREDLLEQKVAAECEVIRSRADIDRIKELRPLIIVGSICGTVIVVAAIFGLGTAWIVWR